MCFLEKLAEASKSIDRRGFLVQTGSLLLATAAPVLAAAPRKPKLLFTNVRIFDGSSSTLRSGAVLIADAKFAAISSTTIEADEHTTVIDGRDRVLMPGLIDAHWHLQGAALGVTEGMLAEQTTIDALTIAEAGRTVARGFTTVRDMAGGVTGLRMPFDTGLFPGPRIFPSGAALSQTSGHGDFSMPYDRPRALGGAASRLEEVGFMTVADGTTAVLAGARENLKKGATQIKVMAGGGASSFYDPLDTLQYTPEELRAAVDAASDWGTYVATHVYTPAGIKRALDAGVKSIEHGQLMDEPSMRLIVEHGAWLSMQPFALADPVVTNWDDAATEAPQTEQQKKKRMVVDGVDRVYTWAKKHGPKLAWGTDLLFDPSKNDEQNEMIARMGTWFSSAEVLQMVTSRNAELMESCGQRNPYGEAKLGVIAEGAWADAILVNGNPLTDLNVLVDHRKNIAVVVKGGTIVKNIVA